MSSQKKNGCGCSSIPISLILLVLGGGYWWLILQGNLGGITSLFNSFKNQESIATPSVEPTVLPPIKSPQLNQRKNRTITTSPNPISVKTAWEQKTIRGIYLSRYQITNNANEKTIRQRVRYYHSQGINTIIHGVWGNGCTMYNSEVMKQKLGYKSCPNEFQDQWLEWLIDEAHKQGMEVHGYFEKGIKIDKNSPIYNLAVNKNWLVPGVDKTYAKINHYVLDVENPEVANFFKEIVTEFVTKYPTINAVQWDDYLGYHAELSGNIDRTSHLTNFVKEMVSDMKKANPKVSFDICHHNPYWSKRYFAADWQNWPIDRAFIQVYNDANFQAELGYAVNYAGVSIGDNQLSRLKELINNPKIKSILIFPLSGQPEAAVSKLKDFH